MLTSISPLGERARGSRWWRTTTSYVVASVIGAAVVGAAFGAVGAPTIARLPGWLLLAAAAAAAAIGAAADISGRLPSIRRQVDETWLTTYRDWVYGAGFGLQLGVGGVTIVTSAATYLTWLLELESGSAVRGLAVGCVFGLVRSLPLLSAGTVRDAVALRRRHARVAGALPAVRRWTVAAQGMVALVLAGAAVRGAL